MNYTPLEGVWDTVDKKNKGFQKWKLSDFKFWVSRVHGQKIIALSPYLTNNYTKTARVHPGQTEGTVCPQRPKTPLKTAKKTHKRHITPLKNAQKTPL